MRIECTRGGRSACADSAHALDNGTQEGGGLRGWIPRGFMTPKWPLHKGVGSHPTGSFGVTGLLYAHTAGFGGCPANTGRGICRVGGDPGQNFAGVVQVFMFVVIYKQGF